MNGKVETEDKSGQPRSEVDLEEALRVVKLAIVKYPLAVPSPLFVQLPTVRDVLEEAIAFRGVTKGKQIGWYNPGDKRFCYMDVKEDSAKHSKRDSYAAYTERVYVFNKP